jgi:hypothetical protein
VLFFVLLPFIIECALNLLLPLNVDSLQDNFLASFLLGWGITIGAGLASYPIDTVRRRMMMTSGQAVKYNSSIDCFQQVRGRGHSGVHVLHRDVQMSRQVAADSVGSVDGGCRWCSAW